MITTCTTCLRAYETGSEEQAYESVRLCGGTYCLQNRMDAENDSEPDPVIKPPWVAERGIALVQEIEPILRSGRYNPADIAFAAAFIGGVAVGMGSEDNCEAFAKNIETFKKAFYKTAEEEFGGRA